MLGTYLDNGFYLITRATALALGGGTLPPVGKERLVVHEGQHYWMMRVRNKGKTEWAVHETSWRLVNGIATLGD